MITDFVIPQPGQQWVDTRGAADLLGRSRATVYDMTERGLLTRRLIGSCAVYWRAQVEEVATALRRLEAPR